MAEMQEQYEEKVERAAKHCIDEIELLDRRTDILGEAGLTMQQNQQWLERLQLQMNQLLYGNCICKIWMWSGIGVHYDMFL